MFLKIFVAPTVSPKG